MKNLLLSALILVLFISCQRTQSDWVSYNEEGVPVIEIENITEEGELTFSDFMTDFEIVRLETKEECMIKEPFRWYISKDYIVVGTGMNGVYLFGRDGSFIRKIIDRGRGPGELIGPYHLEFNEVSQTLYTKADYFSDGMIKAYKLPEAEYREIIINTDADIYDMRYADSVFTLATRSLEDSLRVISQTLSGRVLFRIYHTNEYGGRAGILYPVHGQLMFGYEHGGNKIYFVEDGKLVPHSIYYFKGDMCYVKPQDEVGDVLLFLRPLNANLVWGRFSKVTGLETFNERGDQRTAFGKMKAFIFDKKKGAAYLIPGIKDDYLGSRKLFFTDQSNGLFVQYFTVEELLGLRELRKADTETDEKVKERLNTLCDQLDPNDNPVFLISRMK